MKTIIITGVTGAIGRSAVTELAGRGNLNLVLVGRSYEKLKEIALSLPSAENRVDIFEADLSDLNSVRRLLSEIRKNYNELHALINVASVYKSQKVLTSQQYETMFATNHLGPFVLTTGLLELIKRTPGAKVLTVAAPSKMKIDFGNLNGERKFSSFNAFVGSKMLNLLMAFGLSASFKNSDHASLAFHPGFVKSDLLRESPALVRRIFNFIATSPEKTGKAIADLVLSMESKAQNGKFYDRNLRELQAASYAYDRVIQHRLWATSEHLAAGS